MSASVLRFAARYYLPIVSGILIGTSYIPFPPWASFFAFVPLWIFFFNADSARRIFWGGWITQFTLTLIGFNWVAFTVHEFGHMPWPVSILALLAFSGFANLDVPLAGVTWFFLKRKLNIAGPASLALLGLITALFEAWIPTIFPWNYGYTFYWSGLPVAQLGELIGFQGISALVILTNVLFYRIWQDRQSVQLWLAAAVWIFFLNGAGWWLQKEMAPPDREATFLITQANIGNLEKQYAEHGYGFREPIVKKYVALTEAALSREPADVVVWPETAFPYEIDLRGRTYGENLLSEKVAEWKTPLVTGGYGYGINSHEAGKVSNTFFIFEYPDGMQRGPYIKTHLLAFGEYIPLAETFPVLKKWIPAGDFARGAGPAVRALNGIRLGPQICYESLFPGFSASLADQGAQMLVNLTNDSWYGTWQEPYQHLYMTLARAIEFRRPVVRATNTGISTVALADGTVLEKSPLDTEWTGHFRVPYRDKPVATFYQLYPWLMDTLLIILCLFILGRAKFVRASKS